MRASLADRVGGSVWRAAAANRTGARVRTLVNAASVRQTPAVLRRRRITAIVITALGSGGTWAAPPDHEIRPPRVDLSVGTLGALDGGSPLAMGLEYRWQPFGRWSLVPGAGFVAGDDRSRFAYADLSRSFAVGTLWSATLSFGAGHFDDGTEVRLGHPLVFKSGIEVGRWVDGRWRIGLAFDHLSNGGLSGHNPGTEMLMLRLSAPLGGAGAQSVAAETSGFESGSEPAAASWRSSSRRISSPASAR
jgi:hypothetical protein